MAYILDPTNRGASSSRESQLNEINIIASFY